MCKVLNKEVDLGEPTSFLDYVFLGCTQRHCETRKQIVDNPEFPQEQRSSETPNISTWSYDMEGHAKKCVERYCE